MHLRRVLWLTLTTTPMVGCYAHCWRIPEETYSFSSEITVEQLDEIVSHGYTDVETREDLTCEIICREAYHDRRGWQSQAVTSCSFDPPAAADEGEPAGPGQLTCEGNGVEFYCKGRRPLGHVEAGPSVDGDALGRTLAPMAQLEAASVLAFEQLAEQLAAQGMPSSFIERCLAAAEDERRHARWLTTLAQRHGAQVEPPRVEAHADDRLAIARHNAVEGCVHEAFAALVAGVVAERSPDPVLRRVYARIAEDEARHGQLAWDLHEHWMGCMTRSQRASLQAAQRRALVQLPRIIEWLSRLPSEFGPVSPESATQLANNFAAALAA